LRALDHLQRPEAKQEDAEQRHADEPQRPDAHVERRASDEVLLCRRDRLDDRTAPERDRGHQPRPAPPATAGRYPLHAGRGAGTRRTRRRGSFRSLTPVQLIALSLDRWWRSVARAAACGLSW